MDLMFGLGALLSWARSDASEDHDASENEQCKLTEPASPESEPKRPVTRKRRIVQNSPLGVTPQEILDLIVLELDRDALSNLSQTCAALRNTTLPALFHDITLDLQHLPFVKEASNWDTMRQEFLEARRNKLHQALYKSPELAKLIKSLQLELTVSAHPLFHEILGYTSCLQKLELNYLVGQIYHDDPIEGSHIVAALAPFKQTLTSLKITFEVAFEYQTEGWTPYHSTEGHCSFRDFEVLNFLEISLSILLGWYPSQDTKLVDVLPPSLQTLVLGDAWWLADVAWNDDDTMKTFLNFVEDRKWEASTPSLQTFDVCELSSDYNADLYSPPEAEEYFRGIWEKNGLHCNRFSIPVDWWYQYSK